MAFVVRVSSNTVPTRMRRAVIDPTAATAAAAAGEAVPDVEERLWRAVHPNGPLPVAMDFCHADGEEFDPSNAEDLDLLGVMTRTEQSFLESPSVIRVKAREEDWVSLRVSDADANAARSSSPTTNGVAGGSTGGGSESGASSQELNDVTPMSPYINESPAEELVVPAARPRRGEEGYEPSECLPYVSRHNQLSVFLENATLVVILISVIGFYLETLPRFRLVKATQEERESNHPVFFLIETVCVAWFTIEYAVRWFSAQNKARFPFRPLNIVDLVAILPYYISLGVGSGDASSLAVIRILRLTRVSRIFKFSRHSQGLQDMITCISATTKELMLFLLITSVSTVLFASAIFYIEKDEPDTIFRSIPEGFWWAIITQTTVGYGDISPTSAGGKILGAIAASLGVVLLAIPAGIFISEFMRLHQERKREAMENLPMEERLLAGVEFRLTEMVDKLNDFQIVKNIRTQKLERLKQQKSNASLSRNISRVGRSVFRAKSKKRSMYGSTSSSEANGGGPAGEPDHTTLPGQLNRSSVVQMQPLPPIVSVDDKAVKEYTL